MEDGRESGEIKWKLLQTNHKNKTWTFAILERSRPWNFVQCNGKGEEKEEDHLPLSSGETITNGQDNGTLTWWYSIFRDKLDHSSVL